MGLDMYLYGVIDEFNKSDYNIGHERKQIEIGYWRKANQIHNWFVENIQDGIDNCATYVVFRENLEELKSLCEEIIINPEKAEELLPVRSGFFFGSTEYDEFYMHDIQNTLEIIDYALKSDYDFFVYSSSW